MPGTDYREMAAFDGRSEMLREQLCQHGARNPRHARKVIFAQAVLGAVDVQRGAEDHGVLKRNVHWLLSAVATPPDLLPKRGELVSADRADLMGTRSDRAHRHAPARLELNEVGDTQATARQVCT